MCKWKGDWLLISKISARGAAWQIMAFIWNLNKYYNDRQCANVRHHKESIILSHILKQACKEKVLLMEYNLSWVAVHFEDDRVPSGSESINHRRKHFFHTYIISPRAFVLFLTLCCRFWWWWFFFGTVCNPFDEGKTDSVAYYM